MTLATPRQPALAAAAQQIMASVTWEKTALQAAATERRAALEAGGRASAASAVGTAASRAGVITADIDRRVAEVRSRCDALRRGLEATSAGRARAADAGGAATIAGIAADLVQRRQRLSERGELQAAGSELDGDVEARRIERSAAGAEARLADAAAREVAAQPVGVRNRVAEAVNGVGERAIQELRQNTADNAAGARDTARATAGDLRTATATAARELQGHNGQAEAEVDAAAAAAAHSIEVAGRDHVQQVDALESQLIAPLERMKRTVAEQLHAAGAAAANEALATAADAAADVGVTEQAGLAALDRTDTEARRQLLAADDRRAPQPGSLNAAVAQADAASTQMRVRAAAQFDVVSAAAGARQDGIARALRSGVDKVGTDISRTSDDALSRLSSAEMSLRESLDRRCTEALLDAAATEANARRSAAAALDRQIDDALARVTQQRAHARAEIQTRADRVVASHLSLGRDAGEKMSRAARDAADPSVLRGIGRGALRVLEGIAIFIGVVLLIAAVIWAAAAIIGAGIAFSVAIGIALVVAGVLMFLVGLVFTLIERFEQAAAMMRGKPWGWWLLLGPWVVIVSAGQLFGVTQLLEGFVGHDLVTWDPLDREEIAARITEGVLILATLGLARIVARAFPAPRGFGRPSWWRGPRAEPPGARPPVVDPAVRPAPDGPVPASDQPAPGSDQPAPGPDQPVPGPDQPVPGPDQPAPEPEQRQPEPDRRPPEPVRPVDPWAAVQARHPGLSDAHVAILRELGIDPWMVDRVLTGGVTPDAVVLRAIDGGPRLVEIMDGLATRGVEPTSVNRVAQLAHALDEIFPGRGIFEAVHELATSGRLRNPQSLLGLMEEINTIRNGREGPISELELAAARSRAGKLVQIGAQNRVGADVVDWTDQEAIQNKEITSDQRTAVADRLDEAANQLAGRGARGRLNPGELGSEVPPNRPDGTPFTRTARLIVRNPENPLFQADRVAAERFVRDVLTENRNRGSVDRVQFENGNRGSPFIIGGPF